MSRLLPHHIRCTISPDSAPSLPIPPHPSNQPARRSRKILPPPAPLPPRVVHSSNFKFELVNSRCNPGQVGDPPGEISKQPAASERTHARTGICTAIYSSNPRWKLILVEMGLALLGRDFGSFGRSPSSFFLRRPRNLLSPRDLVPEPPLIYGRRSFVPFVER